MAASRKLRSSAAAAAAGDGDHHRFLRPGALARLRDSRLCRRKRPSRLPPPSSPLPSSPLPPTPPSVPAAGDGVGVSGALMPYFVPVSGILAPRCPQRKKLAAAKAVMLFSPPQPSPGIPVESVMEFLSSPDMVVAAH